MPCPVFIIIFLFSHILFLQKAQRRLPVSKDPVSQENAQGLYLLGILIAFL